MNKQLIKAISQLEVKLWIYNDHWGPDSDEAKEIRCELARLNAELLDLMVSEQEAG